MPISSPQKSNAAEAPGVKKYYGNVMTPGSLWAQQTPMGYAPQGSQAYATGGGGGPDYSGVPTYATATAVPGGAAPTGTGGGAGGMGTPAPAPGAGPLGESLNTLAGGLSESLNYSDYGWGTDTPYGVEQFQGAFDQWTNPYTEQLESLIDPTETYAQAWDEYEAMAQAEKQAAQQMMMVQAQRMGLGASGLGGVDYLGAGMQFAGTMGSEKTKHVAAREAAVTAYNTEKQRLSSEETNAKNALEGGYDTYVNEQITPALEAMTGQGMNLEGMSINPQFKKDLNALQAMMADADVRPEDAAKLMDDLTSQWQNSGYLYYRQDSSGVHYPELGFGSKSYLRANEDTASALGFDSQADWMMTTGGFLRPGDNVSAGYDGGRHIFGAVDHLKYTPKSHKGGYAIQWASQ